MTLKKAFCVFLMAVIVSGLAVGITPFGAVQAESSIPKSSVPEFTVKVGDSKAIEVMIGNQPFVPYYDANSGYNISLYYNVRVKQNAEQNWTILYLIEDVPTQTNSHYTNLSYPVLNEKTNSYILGDKILELPPNSQVDFQVEAMIGYVHRVINPNATSHLELYPYVFTGETSGWSNTQTLTIGENLPPSIEPSVFQTEIVIVIVVVVTVVAAGVLFYFKKRTHRAEAIEANPTSTNVNLGAIMLNSVWNDVRRFGDGESVAGIRFSQ